MANPKSPLPDQYAIRCMAVASYCAERTMRKALLGETVRPTILARIRVALEARGEAHLIGACK